MARDTRSQLSYPKHTCKRLLSCFLGRLPTCWTVCLPWDSVLTGTLLLDGERAGRSEEQARQARILSGDGFRLETLHLQTHPCACKPRQQKELLRMPFQSLNKHTCRFAAAASAVRANFGSTVTVRHFCSNLKGLKTAPPCVHICE